MTIEIKETPAPSVGERIQEAIALQRAGRIDEAEQIYRSALVQEPNNPDALQPGRASEQAATSECLGVAFIQGGTGGLPKQ